MIRRLSLLIASTLCCAPVLAAPPQLKAKLLDQPQIMFKPGDGCDGNDLADMPARVFRDAQGNLAMFALHFNNRLLRGSSFDSLKIDCK